MCLFLSHNAAWLDLQYHSTLEKPVLSVRVSPACERDKT